MDYFGNMDPLDFEEYKELMRVADEYTGHYDIFSPFPSKRGKFTIDDLIDTHEYIKKAIKGEIK